MGALQWVDVPNYAAIIFRRSYQDLKLPGALMDRAHEWLAGTDAVWHASEHTWHFPSGATLTFSYLAHDADVERYQSAEFQYIGFDELTQFTEYMYRYMFSRCRRLKDSTVPLRMRGASNPGNQGHDWVKRRFIIEGKDTGRIFVPATIDDNPHLDKDAYVESLNNLDPITRRRLLAGDWDARHGGSMFRAEWFKVIDKPLAGCHWLRYWDLAATEPGPGKDPDWTAGALLGFDRATGHFCLGDVRHKQGTPQQVEAMLTQTAALDTMLVPVRIEQEPGASGKTLIDYYVRALVGYDIAGDKKSTNKVVRAQPVSSQAEAGNFYIVRGPWVTPFLDEAEAFPNGAHDDQVDAVSGAFHSLLNDKMELIEWG